MMELISKAFNSYYNQLFPDAPLKFKHLRKTYITTLYGKRGELVYKDTDHQGMNILNDSYIDQEMLMDIKRQEFKKFGKIFKE